MNDAWTAFIIIMVLILILFFVRVKAKKAGGFDQYLFQTIFSAVGMLLVYLLFHFFIHIENALLKFALVAVSMAIAASIFDTLGGMIYKGRV